MKDQRVKDQEESTAGVCSMLDADTVRKGKGGTKFKVARQRLSVTPSRVNGTELPALEFQDSLHSQQCG